MTMGNRTETHSWAGTSASFSKSKILAALLIWVLSGCSTGSDSTVNEELQGDEGGESVTGVFIPREARSPAQTDAELEELDRFQAALSKAAKLHAREEYASALVVIESALANNPPEPISPRLYALRLRVKKKLLRRSFLDAFIRFRKPDYTIGAVAEGEIILMNISEEELFIPATVLLQTGAPVAGGDGVEQRTESRATIRSEMTYNEYIPTNTLVTNRNIKNFTVNSDIRLAPGEFHRIPVTINTADINAGGTMYRTYTLSCALHAAEIHVGAQVFHGRIDFRPASVGVFPRNAEHLRKSPTKRMKQALEKNSPVHLTLAAAFVDTGNSSEMTVALDMLEKALAPEDTLPKKANGIMMALQILSGLRETKSKEDWLSWLKDREWTKKSR